MYVAKSPEEEKFLKEYDPNKYRKPSVTVDNIIYNVNRSTGELKVLFVKRKNFPYKHDWALPGGFLDVGTEDTLDAAVRELKEETSLDVHKEDIELFTVSSNPTRDPRDHVVSIVYAYHISEDNMNKVMAADDAEDARFLTVFSDGKVGYFENDLFNLVTLAFDHKQIILDFIKDYNIYPKVYSANGFSFEYKCNEPKPNSYEVVFTCKAFKDTGKYYDTFYFILKGYTKSDLLQLNETGRKLSYDVYDALRTIIKTRDFYTSMVITVDCDELYPTMFNPKEEE